MKYRRNKEMITKGRMYRLYFIHILHIYGIWLLKNIYLAHTKHETCQLHALFTYIGRKYPYIAYGMEMMNVAVWGGRVWGGCDDWRDLLLEAGGRAMISLRSLSIRVHKTEVPISKDTLEHLFLFRMC